MTITKGLLNKVLRKKWSSIFKRKESLRIQSGDKRKLEGKGRNKWIGNITGERRRN